MTIEAGKWYRTPEGQLVRAVVFGSLSCLWHVEDIDGRRWTWPAKQLTPWVPMVGEWVRAGPNGSAYQMTVGGFYVSDLTEPCLPPAEKISDAALATAGVAIVPGSDESEVIDYNGTCPKCGGPAYVGLQNAECLAEKCERVEPDVVRVRHRRGERVWCAFTGRFSATHPIRDEAIRLWREAVRR